MQLRIIPVNESQVQAFSTWRYAPPYDVYNLDAEADDASLDYFLDPAVACHAIVDEMDNLVGFCTFGKDGQVPGGDYSADALDIGMGMRPDLTGQGHGATFRDAVIDFALCTFSPTRLRVTIADFNGRAKRVWEQAGFEAVQRFLSDFGKLDFVVLVKLTDKPLPLPAQQVHYREVDKYIERIMKLPLREQSLCVWLGVEPVINLWIKWCTERNIEDHTEEYIDCYYRWHSGNAADDEFNARAQRLQAVLPVDLPQENDPIGGMVGCALHDVAMIGLGRYEDVHYDIFATSLAYTAAAATGNKNVTIEVDLDRLTDAEMDYINSWWVRCLAELPQLSADIDNYHHEPS